jgi:hypothetical protein
VVHSASAMSAGHCAESALRKPIRHRDCRGSVQHMTAGVGLEGYRGASRSTQTLLATD